MMFTLLVIASNYYNNNTPMQLYSRFSNKTCLFLFVSLFLLSACGGGSGSASIPVPPAFDSQQGYKLEELAFMDSELRNLHPDLFFSKSQNAYELDLEAFRNASSTMSDMEFRLEMAKFIAELGDQHTYITMPINLMKKFPVKVWWVQDRAIVIETDEQYRDLLGKELLSIDGTTLPSLKEVAMQYLAYENAYWKDALSPLYLHLAAVLLNEGIIASEDMATFAFEDVQGERTVVDIASRVDISDWVRIEDTHEAPLLYRLSEDNYAYTIDEGLLYIQYNGAFDVSGYSLATFINDVENAIASGDIEKVVVDIRFNYGGIIDHFVPVIQSLALSSLNTPDSLFVLTGRNSFSSAIGAIYSFQALTEATFVGEPTGGKPNGFSNVVGFRLPGSRNVLYMSTSYLAVTADEVDSFYPDHEVMITQQDFIDGHDPVMSFVRQF